MKKIFFFALMLGAALSFTACGDNDDDNGGGSNKLSTPQYEADAAVHKLNPTITSTDGNVVIEEVEVLANGYMKIKALVPNDDPSAKAFGPHRKSAKTEKFFLVPFKKKGDNIYVLSGKEWKGELEIILTKAGESEQILFDLTFGSYSFSGAAQAIANATPIMAATVQFTNLCRTFKIDKTHIELLFPDKSTPVWKDFDGCNWPAIKEWANQNDANITTEDEGFNKTITTISFSKFGSFTIGYSDGTCDDATWQGLGSSLETLSFNWKNDANMGNKFLENGRIKVTSSGTKYNFTAESDVISGDKSYHVTLQFRTTAQ